MGALKLIVQIVYILVCIGLTFVVLKQEGKVAGLSGTLVGGGDTYWSKNKGRSVEGTLERATEILAGAFAILSVILCLNW
jgi:preprotein translocase subunit SecG